MDYSLIVIFNLVYETNIMDKVIKGICEMRGIMIVKMEILISI